MKTAGIAWIFSRHIGNTYDTEYSRNHPKRPVQNAGIKESTKTERELVRLCGNVKTFSLRWLHTIKIALKWASTAPVRLKPFFALPPGKQEDRREIKLPLIEPGEEVQEVDRKEKS